jgi:hypothetical protein
MREIQSWDRPSPAEFAETIANAARPAVLRGIAKEWPLVRASDQGADAWMTLLADHATDAPIEVMRTESSNEGRFHYTPDGLALNFVRGRTSLPTFLSALREQADAENPFAMAAMGIVAEQVAPDFVRSHPMPYVPANAIPRLWIGNAAKVATHNDPSDNIAVVVAGRRRFTLFPPEQMANLYLGPVHFTPAGTPVSMVHVTAPELDRYPRFAIALESAEVADLEAGDAIFIPYAWYHHVEALERFNMLVNYWWDPAPRGIGSPWDAMLHGLLSLRPLPANQRAAWRAMFDHYVFQLDGDPAEHIPGPVAGILGPVTPEMIEQMRKSLIETLQRDSASGPLRGSDSGSFLRKSE